MNQIQEKDWAEDSWHGHTGIDSSCDYCIVDEEMPKDQSETNVNPEDANVPSRI
jgi:hypothetical protein